MLTVKVLRGAPDTIDSGTVRALDLKGLPLGEASFSFKAADKEAEARFDLPVEIRNDIARIEIAGERSAGAVQLLDKRWSRRTVGIVSGATADTSQPLSVIKLLYRPRARPVRRRAACASRSRRRRR